MSTKLTYSSEEDSKAKKLIISSVEYLTGRSKLERKYNEILDAQPKPEDIWNILLAKLDIKLIIDDYQLSKIPKKGPLIFIANHPYGVVDGIIMGHIASKIRPNFKFLVNSVLCKEEILNNFFLPIDFSNSKEAQKTNINTRKVAIEELSKETPIVIFPSGGVATAPKFWKKAVDLEWKQFVVKLIKKSEATVVPIYFHGQNSRLFQIVSQFSMDLRLALLLNEVRNKVGNDIKVEIGDPIEYAVMEEYNKKKRLLEFLNQQVHQLGESQLISENQSISY